MSQLPNITDAQLDADQARCEVQSTGHSWKKNHGAFCRERLPAYIAEVRRLQNENAFLSGKIEGLTASYSLEDLVAKHRTERDR